MSEIERRLQALEQELEQILGYRTFTEVAPGVFREGTSSFGEMSERTYTSEELSEIERQGWHVIAVHWHTEPPAGQGTVVKWPEG